ncbi:PLAC8 family protein [Trifolium repens]|nr:PLAC8 family protein [Trifolium repens]
MRSKEKSSDDNHQSIICRKHRVEILLPIVAAICVLFVKSTVKYENDLGIPEATDMKLAVVTAPPVQTMQSDSGL